MEGKGQRVRLTSGRGSGRVRSAAKRSTWPLSLSPALAPSHTRPRPRARRPPASSSPHARALLADTAHEVAEALLAQAREGAQAQHLRVCVRVPSACEPAASQGGERGGRGGLREEKKGVGRERAKDRGRKVGERGGGACGECEALMRPRVRLPPSPLASPAHSRRRPRRSRRPASAAAAARAPAAKSRRRRRRFRVRLRFARPRPPSKPRRPRASPRRGAHPSGARPAGRGGRGMRGRA